MAIYTLAQLKGLAANAGFSDPTTAAAIAEAESSGNSTVVNSIGCVGLWQVNSVAWRAQGWTVQSLQDPVQNAQAAYAVYQAQGWQAWTTYTSGAYKKYMPAATSAKATGGTNTANGGLGNSTDTTSTSTLSDTENLIQKISDPKFWERVAYVLIGVILVIMALVKMGAQNKSIQTVAKAAGKVAEVAAV